MDLSTLFLPVRRIEADVVAAAEHEADQWPGTLPPVRQLLREGLDLGPVTILTGQNGTGKSTVLEALAMAYGMNPEGGSTGAMHVTRPSESPLHEQLKLIRGAAASRKGFFLRAETMHSFYSYLEESRFKTSLHERSHGESILELIQERLPTVRGLWLFDEPESALSMHSCIELVHLMQRAIQDGSQVVISTHSPVLAAFPGAQIYQLSDAGFELVDYDRLELVTGWRSFLADPAGHFSGR
ncbi:AAA family ATPase [Glutamicibacter endophyticus]